MTLSGKALVFLWCGVAAVVIRNVSLVAAALATPGYSMRRDFLSELSAIDAPYASAMNILSLELVGTLIILAAIALFREMSQRPAGHLSAMLIGLSGAAFIGIGLTPCDPGCVPVGPSLRMLIHLLSGAIAMGALSLSALVVGLGGFWRRPLDGPGLAGLVLGTISVISFGLLFSSAAWLEGNAGFVQRVIQASGDLWILVVCLHYARANH